jgi:hypothetical protein
MRRFDPGPRLQHFLLKFNKISIVGLLSTPVHGCGLFVLNFGESAKIGLNREGGRTKDGPYLHHGCAHPYVSTWIREGLGMALEPVSQMPQQNEHATELNPAEEVAGVALQFLSTFLARRPTHDTAKSPIGRDGLADAGSALLPLRCPTFCRCYPRLPSAPFCDMPSPSPFPLSGGKGCTEHDQHQRRAVPQSLVGQDDVRIALRRTGMGSQLWLVS